MDYMTIGKVADAAGVGVETVRFYERKGLVKPVLRMESGYRQYTMASVERLQFIRRAKALGFTLSEIGSLLDLHADANASCATVKARAQAKLDELDQKIQALMRIRSALEEISQDCQGSGVVGECTILDALLAGRDHQRGLCCTDNGSRPKKKRS